MTNSIKKAKIIKMQIKRKLIVRQKEENLNYNQKLLLLILSNKKKVNFSHIKPLNKWKLTKRSVYN